MGTAVEGVKQELPEENSLLFENGERQTG